MTRESLDLLETRVREAAELVAALRSRVAELEERLRERAAQPQAGEQPAEAGWREDRATVHSRIRALVARLEELVED